MLATSLCALRTGNVAGLIAKMLVPDLKREIHIVLRQKQVRKKAL
jgi:hypothetical protein